MSNWTKEKRDNKTGMDQVKALLGVYDPNADKLAADFRSRISSNLGSLNDTIKQADEVKNIITKIPGVSDETKNQMNFLLESAKSFTDVGGSMTPDQLAAQKDKIDLLMKTTVSKAQDEAKAQKVAEIEKKAEVVKENKANETFSAGRLFSRIWETGKYYLIGAIVIGLALWGGSMSSNAAIDKSVAMRIYYLIYGTILFPVSFGFAIWRWMSGKGGSYHAMLAPLIPRPVSSMFIQYLLFPFLYNPSGIVSPIPIEPAPIPQYNSEAAVMIQADANEAISSLGTQV